jgi:hypothetical protein
MTGDGEARSELLAFARDHGVEGLATRDARVFLDERQDGEPVTRVVLVLDDPTGDTWDVEAVTELRRSLGRRATELGLPGVSVTLIPKSEAELIETLPGR